MRRQLLPYHYHYYLVFSVTATAVAATAVLTCGGADAQACPPPGAGSSGAVVGPLAAHRVYAWDGLSQYNASRVQTPLVWALFGVSVVFVAARLCTRLPAMNESRRLTLWWDDWTILVGLLALIPNDVISQLLVNRGFGQDTATLSPEQLSDIFKFLFIEKILYAFVICITKASMVCLYVRIFHDARKARVNAACYVLLGVTAAYWVELTLAVVLECSPVDYSWTQWDPARRPSVGQCRDQTVSVYVNSGINIALDLCVFLLPIPILLRSAASRQRKLGLCLVFLTGLFITACSAIRIYTIQRHSKTQNPTSDLPPIVLWSYAEMHVSVLCVCLPGLTKLLRHLLCSGSSRAFNSSNSYRTSSTSPPRARPAAGGVDHQYRRNNTSSHPYGVGGGGGQKVLRLQARRTSSYNGSSGDDTTTTSNNRSRDRDRDRDRDTTPTSTPTPTSLGFGLGLMGRALSTITEVTASRLSWISGSLRGDNSNGNNNNNTSRSLSVSVSQQLHLQQLHLQQEQRPGSGTSALVPDHEEFRDYLRYSRFILDDSSSGAGGGGGVGGAEAEASSSLSSELTESGDGGEGSFSVRSGLRV